MCQLSEKQTLFFVLSLSFSGIQDGERAFKVDNLKKTFTVDYQGSPIQLRHGSLLVASVTNCTNGSHPSTMLTAGKCVGASRMRASLVCHTVCNFFHL